MATGFLAGTLDMDDGLPRNLIGSGVAVVLLLLEAPNVVVHAVETKDALKNPTERIKNTAIHGARTALAGGLTYAAVRYLQRPYGM